MTHTYTQVDVTSTDPYEIARLWGEEVVGIPGGLLALRVKEHCFVRTVSKHASLENGEPGDVLIVHNQKMQRRIITGNLFEFLYGEKL